MTKKEEIKDLELKINDKLKKSKKFKHRHVSNKSKHEVGLIKADVTSEYSSFMNNQVFSVFIGAIFTIVLTLLIDFAFDLTSAIMVTVVLVFYSGLFMLLNWKNKKISKEFTYTIELLSMLINKK
ncbi:hypothetical protein [Gracilibacillus thailandensis]|uniref:Uncharacterized protein n=1 Tax=Gracilibacillus thailandensis TaxID=563735 RepID=A0A6N7R5W4_9BACI|nr:hypothetical protein [Gracilibacillus thailandensis]MRI68639.1 hypothetical protein [Gracilibacillus thailandensis]